MKTTAVTTVNNYIRAFHLLTLTVFMQNLWALCTCRWWHSDL